MERNQFLTPQILDNIWSRNTTPIAESPENEARYTASCMQLLNLASYTRSESNGINPGNYVDIANDELRIHDATLPTIGFEVEFPSNTGNTAKFIDLMTTLGFPKNQHNALDPYETYDDRSAYTYPNILEISTFPSKSSLLQSKILELLFESGIIPTLNKETISTYNLNTDDEIANFIHSNITDQMYALHINLGLPKSIVTEGTSYLDLIVINAVASILFTSIQRLSSNQFGPMINTDKSASFDNSDLSLARVELRSYDVLGNYDQEDLFETIQLLTKSMINSRLISNEGDGSIWLNFRSEALSCLGLDEHSIFRLIDPEFLILKKSDNLTLYELSYQTYLALNQLKES